MKTHQPLRHGVSRQTAVVATTVALAATLAICIAGFHAVNGLRDSYERIVTRDLYLSEIVDHLVYLDEALTLSAVMAATTNDESQLARYAVLAREYDRTWQRVRAELTGEQWRGSITAAEAAAAELLRFEREALALAAARRRTAGAAVVAGESYSAAKTRFAAALTDIQKGVRAELALERDAASERNRNLLVVCAVLLLVVAASWIVAAAILTAYMRAYDRSVGEIVDSQQRFDLAARATADVIWDWDLAGSDVWFSDAFSSSFGYASAGSIDVAVWSDAIHPDDAARVGESLEAAFAGDVTFWSGEYRFRNAAGEWRHVFDRGYIVRDASGTAVRMIGAMMDVTERRLADETAARLNRQHQLILSSVGDGIFGLDMAGKVLFINDAGAEILGWTAEELVGKHLHSLCHHTLPDGAPYPWADCAAHATLSNGTTETRRDEMFSTRAGRTVPVEYTSSPMLDDSGATVGAVVAFRDVSERRAIDRMKDEFISTVSHELRTPLTSIRGALGLLATGRLGELAPKASRLVDIAASNTDRLVRLINDILDVERIESGAVKLEKSACVAGELVSAAVETVRSLADAAQITIDAHHPHIPVLADADRVVQTLTNLLANAVKFSPRGSKITVRCTPADGHVLFSVADDGRGIPADKLESVFERFQQVDASDSRDSGGSGLGLPICRGIVRQHGGRIWAESEPGRGSTFAFTIPAERQRVAVPEISDARRTVLVCDDDPDARALMSALLEKHGYRAREIASGHDLLASVASERADLILLDLLMPDMNGFETLARLREEPGVCDTPVVVVSRLSAEETGVPLTNIGGWVAKPLVADCLVETVDRALAMHRRPKMMVIEDDADLARVIATSFERHGVETIHAANGREAIELARTIEPDVVVLDLVLPELDGFAVVDWLRDHDRWRNVPLVVYSALEPTPSQRARLELGHTEFLTKSRISPEEFERRIIALFDTIITARTKGQLPDVA